MEKKFIFLRLVSGQKKDGSFYYFMDYVKPENFEPFRQWYNHDVEAFHTLEKKIQKGSEFKTFTGLFNVDNNNKAYICDIK